jgi:peptidoglycan/LPS O-acetylase OafA/YrhL
MSEGDRDRIAPVDGLRAVAVLGVIWAHAWAFSGTPAINIGRIGSVDLDLNRAISIVGSGVDLFFVISGFCMYMMYAGRQTVFSWRNYLRFLRRRWLRIAPAFYSAAAVAALGFVVAGLGFPSGDLAAHLVFLHTVIPDTGRLAAPFWSLATEWHFYMLLPMIVWGSGRLGFWPTIMSAAAFCLCFRLWVYGGAGELLDATKTQLPTRLVEFAWGICVARFHAEGRVPPALLRGAGGFVLGVIVAYAGRLLMVTEVVRGAGSYGFLLQVLAEPVMTAGFAMLLWNVIASDSWFQRALSTSALTLVGRWSYSLYLWHWWPTVWIASELAGHFGSNAWVQYLSFACSLVLLLPLAWISYVALERPYFESRARLEISAASPGARA